MTININKFKNNFINFMYKLLYKYNFNNQKLISFQNLKYFNK